MSGGHYDYQGSRLEYLANDLESDAIKYAEDHCDQYEDVYKAEPPHVLEAMNYCAAELRRVGKLAHSIEWYMSGDTGVESIQAALDIARGDTLSDQQIIDIAEATGTAESGANGYVLPISFARAILNANQYNNKR